MGRHACNLFIGPAGYLGLLGLQDENSPSSDLAKEMASQMIDALKEASEEFRKAHDTHAGELEGVKYGRVRVTKGGWLGWFEWLVPDTQHEVFEFSVGQYDRQQFRVVVGDGRLEVTGFNSSTRATTRSLEISKLKEAGGRGMKLLPVLATGYSLLEGFQTAASYSEADKQIEILEAYRDVIRSTDTAGAALKIGILTKKLYDSPFSLYAGLLGSLGSSGAEAIANAPAGVKNRVVQAVDKVIADIRRKKAAREE